MSASPELVASIGQLATRSLGGKVTRLEPIAAGLGPRTFFRLTLEGAATPTAIARVDAPEDPVLRPQGVPPEPDFETVRAWLEAEGLPVPRGLGRDPGRRIDLIEDLGTQSLQEASRSGQAPQRRALYRNAVELVPRLQRLRPPATHPTADRTLDASLFRYKAEQVVAWLLPFSLHREARASERQVVLDGFNLIATACASAPQRVAHRDFQSTNLYVRNAGHATGRLAMIDFQGAFLAPPEYDLVCLLRDPHVELPDQEVRDLLAWVREQLPDRPTEAEFDLRFALLTLARCGKDLARYRYALMKRGDTRYGEEVYCAARFLRAAAEHTHALEPRLATLCELLRDLPNKMPDAQNEETRTCEP